ncbi:hypothetical protein N7468_003728 [Penicillium chermesinum]|uniref:Ubiquitin-activating enzyme E1-like n=1 Tax=Penicillium chermesinum TaxID=63820 RepID=A0A9W9TTN6_9EURO|nr:uncharacterized protein N7468_003728 [Penicillium chermesinum]KAJ5239109.1 hypothetical protein N7468_003728 [Penicillium chermesinum]
MPATSIKRSLGVDLTTKIHESRVLLVGAGGIGCELLKNLVLTGFGEIHIIDLDTIDLSNLNRQFLFRHEHIKKSKALVCNLTSLFLPSPGTFAMQAVAKEIAQKFRPNAKLEAYHANITDSRFNVAWFSKFDIVFNALDNLAARRHVNHMCLAANVPLIESGTTGFNGQVQVIEKGKTECYDCNPKPTVTTYPVCTIRTTPSQPIHCIIWGKSYLLPELFGKGEDDNGTIDTSETAENAEEIGELRREAKELEDIRESMDTEEFEGKVFEKVFKHDIERLRGAEGMWEERKPPEPLDYDKLNEESASIDSTISKVDQREWTLAEAFVVFRDALNRLRSRLKELKASASPTDPTPTIEFDKDDEDTLDFVTATGILRGTIFGIDSNSKFKTKEMAGNIIPAIATTNAMTAGLCVLQSFKVLQDDLRNAKMVFLERSGARVINSDSLNPPRPDCAVCSVISAQVAVDLASATLEDIVEGVLKLKLGYGEEFSILKGQGVIYDPDLEDNLSKKLQDLGLGNQSFLTVVDEDDQDQDPRVNLELIVVQREETAEGAKPAQLMPEELEIPRKPKHGLAGTDETQLTNGNVSNGKRKRDSEDDQLKNGPVAKKVAAESNGNGEVIDLDDEGAILIDD